MNYDRHQPELPPSLAAVSAVPCPSPVHAAPMSMAPLTIPMAVKMENCTLNQSSSIRNIRNISLHMDSAVPCAVVPARDNDPTALLV